VTATDVWDNTSSAGISVVFEEDTTPPAIIIERPVPDETVTTSPVVVEGIVTDDVGVGAVYVNDVVVPLVGGRFETSVD